MRSPQDLDVSLYKRSLAYLLRHYEQSESRHPRDSVYALLILVNEQRGAEKVTTDYGESAAELFFHLTCYENGRNYKPDFRLEFETDESTKIATGMDQKRVSQGDTDLTAAVPIANTFRFNLWLKFDRLTQASKTPQTNEKHAAVGKLLDLWIQVLWTSRSSATSRVGGRFVLLRSGRSTVTIVVILIGEKTVPKGDRLLTIIGSTLGLL